MPSKTSEKVSFVVIVTLCIGGINMLSNQLPKLWGAGASHAKVEQDLLHLQGEVHRIDSQGCSPSIYVREDVAGLKKSIESIQTTQTQMREDFRDDMKDIKEMIGQLR